MKTFILILALISTTIVSAEVSDEISADNFYYSPNIMKPCFDYAKNLYPDEKNQLVLKPLVDGCIKSTENIFITKTKFMSNWILKECLSETSQSESAACLEKINSVNFTSDASTKCKGLSLQQCTKLYIKSPKIEKVELGDKLMKNLKEAVEKGDLKKARLILDKLEEIDGSAVGCRTKLEGINNSQLQKLSDDTDEVIEKNKKNSSR